MRVDQNSLLPFFRLFRSASSLSSSFAGRREGKPFQKLLSFHLKFKHATRAITKYTAILTLFLCRGVKRSRLFCQNFSLWDRLPKIYISKIYASPRQTLFDERSIIQRATPYCSWFPGKLWNLDRKSQVKNRMTSPIGVILLYEIYRRIFDGAVNLSHFRTTMLAITRNARDIAANCWKYRV